LGQVPAALYVLHLPQAVATFAWVALADTAIARRAGHVWDSHAWVDGIVVVTLLVCSRARLYMGGLSPRPEGQSSEGAATAPDVRHAWSSESSAEAKEAVPVILGRSRTEEAAPPPMTAVAGLDSLQDLHKCNSVLPSTTAALKSEEEGSRKNCMSDVENGSQSSSCLATSYLSSCLAARQQQDVQEDVGAAASSETAEPAERLRKALRPLLPKAEASLRDTVSTCSIHADVRKSQEPDVSTEPLAEVDVPNAKPLAAPLLHDGPSASSELVEGATSSPEFWAQASPEAEEAETLPMTITDTFALPRVTTESENPPTSQDETESSVSLCSDMLEPSHCWRTISGDAMLTEGRLFGQHGNEDDVAMQLALAESLMDAEGPPELEWTTMGDAWAGIAGGYDVIRSEDMERLSQVSKASYHSFRCALEAAQEAAQKGEEGWYLDDDKREECEAEAVAVLSEPSTSALATLSQRVARAMIDVESSHGDVILAMAVTPKPFRANRLSMGNGLNTPVRRSDLRNLSLVMGRGRCRGQALWWGRLPPPCRARVAMMVGAVAA